MTETAATPKKQVEIFTDGACSGNPGPGGWGAILRYNGKIKELSGGEALTTNNRMELMAAISQDLRSLAGPRRAASPPQGPLALGQGPGGP